MDGGLRAPRGKTGELPEITFLVRKVRERIVRKAKSGRGLSCTLAGRGEQAPGVPVTVSRGAGPERPPRRRGRAPSRGQCSRPRPPSPGRPRAPGCGQRAAASGWLTCAPPAGPPGPVCLPPPVTAGRWSRTQRRPEDSGSTSLGKKPPAKVYPSNWVTRKSPQRPDLPTGAQTIPLAP